MFAKRARPAPQQRQRGSSPEPETGGGGSDAEGGSRTASGQAGAGAARRKLLALDEDEDTEGFQVKKSKLSRQLAKAVRTGAPPPGARRAGLTSAVSARARLRGSREDLEVLGDSGDEAGDEPMVVEATASEPIPGEAVAPGPDDEGGASDGSGEATRSGMRARLARAQRAAARELYGGSGGGSAAAPAQQADFVPMSKPSAARSATTGVERSSPFESQDIAAALGVRAASGPVRLPDEEEEVVDEEDWAMQQMRVGAHRRHGGTPLEVFGDDLMSRGPLPPSKRDGPTPRTDVRLGTGGTTGGGSSAASAAAAASEGGGGASASARKQKAVVASPAEALAKLWATVKSIEEGETDRVGRSKDLDENCEEADKQLKFLKRQSDKLDKGLRTAQELDQYVWSLAGLLDAKVSKLKQAGETLGQMEREFSERRTKRRRRNLVAALRSAGAVLSAAGSEDQEEAPEADRAPRRPRQSRRKEPREGWDTSSASEDGLGELSEDRAAFCAAAHKQIAADVSEEFSATPALLEPLKGAKKKLEKGEYSQAFVPQSLPEALAMHIDHSLLWWDPLQLCSRGGSNASSASWGPRRPVAAAQLESFEWFDELSGFTELLGEADPDAELVPQLVQRCVFPEVARRLRDCWDVTSAPQSERVAQLLDECLLFETDESSSSSFSGLLDAAVQRLERGLAELAPEVFVAAPEMQRWYASGARWRLLWRSCKIAQCAVKLEGRVPDERLGPLVLGAVFGTRMAPHLRAPRLEGAEMELVEQFVGLLPQRWLAHGVPPSLASLRDALGPRAPRGPEASATAAQASRVLRRLGCFDEAQALEAAMA
mmetsp:Transcript_156415/g.501809  ORF Transcript_156415/g.501809 Transcript_156415/m.501809 type:complete len:830 (-) Transcript_156415:59-2548(-)|eukprot:CAMPEP_0203886536 /NCGR_PEP_ID=MMETSP0359-20131031/30334_1 /ASSEMBLY_ACC=CAM_ASM_000338 /TAXON_ID=268821 /ORGANISM="Scrippsiella Hangoei, Strain SHTV-5" /LENGTH=829 /DNA_ID=CAMNT_0050807377 /DNA_START=63 /DNA_END=2552 /DNA_ORIENTATION=-